MIDSHCHLADDVFAGDVEAVIERARASGLVGALCIVDVANATERLRTHPLVAKWPALRFGVGVHPHQAGAWTGRTSEVAPAVRRAVLEQPATRAIGEIGLDYHYDLSPRDVQRTVFATQVDLASSLELPIVIHAREADEDAVDVLREAGDSRRGTVMHCFTGSVEFARRTLDLGCYISLAGIVTFPKAEELRAVARFVPDDRLLAETDSPFLAPVPYRGKRNEPAWVMRVIERLAEVRGVTAAELGSRLLDNYERLFRP